MKHPVAAVTMVYNEPRMLPFWTKYYVNQCGSSSCYVVDHGSNDGSTSQLDLNVVKIPRSLIDEEKKATFLSRFCSSLLEWYETVICTEVDEILLPDPNRFKTLVDYCQRTSVPVSTTIGLAVQHVLDLDNPLQWDAPILRQRSWARFAFYMCKPLVTKVPIKWTPGLHSSDKATTFDGIFLFNLQHFDLPTALRRLEKTRETQWHGQEERKHHTLANAQYEEMIRATSRLERIDGLTFEEDDPYLCKRTKWILDFLEQNPDERHAFHLKAETERDHLLRIPNRFLDLV